MRTARLVAVLFLVVGIAGAAACRRGSDDVSVTLDIVSVDPQPPVVGPAELRLRLLDEEGRPIVGLGSVEVEATMSHAGMEPVVVQAREDGDGVYVTEGLAFTMAGDWVVIVRGTWQGRAFEASTPLAGVRPAP